MRVEYRKLFLKDLKKLKKQAIYPQIYELAFTTLPSISMLQELSNIKAMVNTSNRYRIRVGNYRVGIELDHKTICIMRVLHRSEFYRYFP